MIRNCFNIKEIAEGGQKKVFLAEHPNVGKVVIKRGEIRSFTSLERIKREVDLLSEINSSFLSCTASFQYRCENQRIRNC